MVEARKKKVKEAGVKEELYPWLNLLQELEKPWGTEGSALGQVGRGPRVPWAAGLLHSQSWQPNPVGRYRGSVHKVKFKMQSGFQREKGACLYVCGCVESARTGPFWFWWAQRGGTPQAERGGRAGWERGEVPALVS